MVSALSSAGSASVADLHRQWLELVDTDGPFLAVSPLKRVWPQGMPALPEDRKEALVDARKDFESAWEAFDRSARRRCRARRVPGRPRQMGRDRSARCRRVGGVAVVGQVPGVQAQSPNRR